MFLRKPHGVSLLVVALSACQHLDHEELDRLNRLSEARTVILEDEFSLYSVFSFEETLPYARMVREELALVADLFEVEIDRPILGRLLGVDEITPTIQATTHSITAKWLGGTAGDGSFSIFLTEEFQVNGPDGKTIRVQLGENKYRYVIRHELAHVCVELLGIRDKLWLTEGVAEEVESMEVAPAPSSSGRKGVLVYHPMPENLLTAIRQAPQRRSLRSVLSLRQDGEKIAKGLEDIDTEGRAYCHALVRFFAVRNPRLTFPEMLRELDSLSVEEIVGLEDEFYAWLAEQGSRLDDSPMQRDVDDAVDVSREKRRGRSWRPAS